ncbi:MAG: hypothetical protein JXA00_00775 [Candidatus Thermoplasmatota archaeon]|nr:hypothetical protein [Candidatus Thermoplasmatota archaeon]
MELFGFYVPFWVVLVGILGLVILLWGVIKFAVKLLVVIALIFLVIIGLDVLVGLFSRIGL